MLMTHHQHHHQHHHHHPLHNNHGHQPIGCMGFLRYNQDRDDFDVGKTSKIKVVVNKSR
jgi:hypothetical protein